MWPDSVLLLYYLTVLAFESKFLKQQHTFMGIDKNDIVIYHTILFFIRG